jgi:molybdate transport system ATP-binding protein
MAERDMHKRGGLHVRLWQAGPIPLAVEFSCEQGELLALIGLSGSGKTTTLRSIAGLYHPRDGQVRCNGTVWLDTKRGLDLPPHRRPVGFVFQSYALFPHMTALGNVVAALGHLPADERLERARDLLTLVHLKGFEQRRPAALSGGQQQRVAVARALVMKPALLLADEPTGDLDETTADSLHALLREMHAEYGLTSIIATHNPRLAAACDRVLRLELGQLRAV